ncbi:TonB-dependent siderophore receptor [Nostoc sp.]|uniref:TonB-dependent siderophore receptor n=1 Tax=Nostoc sp. TaxID=1180 RepID=UPI003FA5C003
MKRWLSGSVRLWFLLSLFGYLSTIAIEPVQAEIKSTIEKQEVESQENLRPLLTRKIRQLSEVERPSTSAQMLVQSPTPSNHPNLGGEVVPITGVKANRTDKGVEIILETPVGTQLQVTNRSTGNNFIADVSGGQLHLPSGEAFTFRSEKPVEGITEITVTNIDATTVRVAVVGEKALPTVELFDDNAGLVFGITSAEIATSPPQQPQTPQTQEKPALPTPQNTPSAQGDEPIELVVTGEQDGYRVRDSSTATKTDTPLRDIPQSIQVVPQQVLEDQQVRNPNEALRNIAGVSQGQNSASRSGGADINIRGFDATANILRNGLRDPTGGSGAGVFNLANIERIEVLKGPASVLYGQGSFGGLINYVTKQPLTEPYYSVEASAGSFNFYSGAVDLTGPLNDSKTVLYRLNLAALTTESFVDFYEEQQYFVAPVLTWQISDRTKLTLEAEYLDRPKANGNSGVPAVGSVLPNPNGRIPRNRTYTERDPNKDDVYSFAVGYDLQHRFSENWQLRNAFRFSQGGRDRDQISSSSLAEDQRTLSRTYALSSDQEFGRFFNLDTYVVGKFATGSVEHQLLMGFNLTREESTLPVIIGRAAPINLFNPVYGQPIGDVIFRFDLAGSTDTLGIYVQDQVTLFDNLKLLLGVRFDTFRSTSEDRIANTEEELSDSAFSPRVGIVYQPFEPISLYASYSRAFNPVTGVTSFEGDAFQPERATQYEVGIKADLSDRLSATLAFYDITRSNVVTADPVPDRDGFSVQTGEQRSRGIEFNIGGEILPGWNLIAGYAYTDAQITQDNELPVGNLLRNTPRNSFNLWTSYEFQRGPLQGFGAGVGFFFVGERQGDLPNTFELPSYFLTDAAIFYKRDRFRASLNFRNLFDVNYYDSANNRVSVNPGDPFTVQGTISWKF